MAPKVGNFGEMLSAEVEMTCEHTEAKQMSPGFSVGEERFRSCLSAGASALWQEIPFGMGGVDMRERKERKNTSEAATRAVINNNNASEQRRRSSARPCRSV